MFKIEEVKSMDKIPTNLRKNKKEEDKRMAKIVRFRRTSHAVYDTAHFQAEYV